MRFISTVLTVLGFVALAQAASLTFFNKDVFDLIMCFVPTPNHRVHDGVYVPAGQTVSTNMDYEWNGAVFTIFPGEDAWAKYYGGTVLAEFHFHYPEQPWLMSYDVSAIHAPNYNDGVHRIWPKDINGYNVGCYRFPCDDAYLPSDPNNAAKSHTTTNENLVVQVGLENRFAMGIPAPDPHLLIPQKSYPGLPADPALAEILARHFNQTTTD